MIKIKPTTISFQYYFHESISRLTSTNNSLKSVKISLSNQFLLLDTELKLFTKSINRDMDKTNIIVAMPIFVGTFPEHFFEHDSHNTFPVGHGVGVELR